MTGFVVRWCSLLPLLLLLAVIGVTCRDMQPVSRPGFYSKKNAIKFEKAFRNAFVPVVRIQKSNAFSGFGHMYANVDP